MALNPDAAFRGDVMREVWALKRQLRAIHTARRLESAAIGEGGIRVRGGRVVIQDIDGNETFLASTDGLTLSGLLHVLGAIQIEGDEGLRIIGGGNAVIRDGGDIRVRDGGSVFVEAGGALAAENGAAIRALYASGETALVFGTLFSAATGQVSSHGLLVQGDPAAGGTDIFRAKRDADDGDTTVFIGSTTSGVPNPVDEFTTWANRIELNARGSDGATDRWNLVLTSNASIYLQPVSTDVIIDPIGTSGNPANVVHVGGSNRLAVSTSSRRYKTDIADANIDPTAVLRLRPRTWLPAPETIREGEDGSTRGIGFVAEELDDIGLGAFVGYDDEGQPDSIAYDRLTAALAAVVQAQQAQLDDQQSQIDALTARVDQLTG